MVCFDPASAMKPNEIRNDKAFDTDWFHAIEPAPEVYPARIPGDPL